MMASGTSSSTSTGRPGQVMVGRAAHIGPLLDVRGVVVAFGGIRALDSVSFTVDEGQICGLIGPNGAGKTTLFNCLSRFYDFEGSIGFDGRELARAEAHAVAGLGLARTFQHLALVDNSSVLQNVLLGGHPATSHGFLANGLRFPAIRREYRRMVDRANECLGVVGLGAHRHSRVGDLPFGFRKRVELARALMMKPKLLLLDEPAAGLNHTELGALADLTRDIRDRFGVTILLVEHHMSFVMGLCDKIVVLDFGRKIAEGVPAGIRAHPDVIRAYLGEAM